MTVRMTAHMTVMLAGAVLLAVPGGTAQEPAVGWELHSADQVGEFSPPADYDGTDRQVEWEFEDGVLRFSGYLERASALWGTIPIPAGTVDLNRYPVLEIEWRHNTPDSTNLMMRPRLEPERPDGITLDTYYWTERAGQDQWVTHASRLLPDVGFPGERSATRLTRIRFAGYSWADPGEYTFEIRKLRLRALTEEEQEFIEVRAAPLRDYQPPPLPERMRNTFVYGTCHTAPSVGGWEGFLDELARGHFNTYFGTGHWYADVAHVARLAEPRGLMLFPWALAGYSSYQGTWEGAGLEGSRRTAARQIAEVEGLSAIAGWYLADEPDLGSYLGVAGVQAIYGELDPERVALHVHFNPDRLKYWDRFSTVNTSDMYPLQGGRRNPWAIAEWCRDLDQFSDTPHWLWPQAFGIPGTAAGGYHYPTDEEFRLMMYLALANGTKGFILFDYWYPQWMALADRVGNPTSLGQEAARLGEEWIPIGALLVEARGIYDPIIEAQATGGAERGVSVGAMGEAQTGPLFLVATNESLEVEQGAEARMPAEFVRPDRAVYDLHTLRRVSPAGSATFEIAPLRPGDGRIYLLGNRAQFTAAREQILTNRVEERLRVQGADRVIGNSWRAEAVLDQHDRDVEEVHSLLQARSWREAERKAAEAGRTLQEGLRGVSNLGEASTALAEVKQTLGSLNRDLLHYVYDEDRVLHTEQPREGMEDRIELFEALCARYSQVRHDYLRGPFTGASTDSRTVGPQIRAAAEELRAEVQAFAEQVAIN